MRKISGTAGEEVRAAFSGWKLVDVVRAPKGLASSIAVKSLKREHVIEGRG